MATLEKRERLEQRLADYEALLEIGVELAGTLELERVLELALQKAERLCRAESSSIWELDEESGELFFRVVRGVVAGEIGERRVPLGVGIVGSVAESGESELVNDVASDPRWAGDSASGFTTRAILTVPLVARGHVVGVLQLLNPVDRGGFTADDRRRMELLAGAVANAVANARLYSGQKRLLFESITALSEAIEKRDPYTGGHVHRVVSYSVLIGHEMGLERGELEELRLAAALHDVGKIAIPDAILRKPTPLAEEELEIMRCHVEDGAEIVGRVRSLRHLLSGILHHHERIDGAGYPDGLSGEELPTIPRIIGVADTYDAMTTDRPYRAALTHQEAVEEIREGAGTQFCPVVAAAFGRLCHRGALTLENGERLLAELSQELIPPES